MFNFFKQLNERELRWLDRRSRGQYVIGIPSSIRQRIIKLGYGTPYLGGSFNLTPKGLEYLRKYGQTHSRSLG